MPYKSLEDKKKADQQRYQSKKGVNRRDGVKKVEGGNKNGVKSVESGVKKGGVKKVEEVKKQSPVVDIEKKFSTRTYNLYGIDVPWEGESSEEMANPMLYAMKLAQATPEQRQMEEEKKRKRLELASKAGSDEKTPSAVVDPEKKPEAEVEAQEADEKESAGDELEDSLNE